MVSNFTKQSNKMLNKMYPFLSIGAIEIGTLLENSDHLVSLFVFFIQLLIGFLTIIKLYKEIKIKKSTKTDEQINAELKKKNRFLFSFLSVLKNFRNK